MTKDIQGHTNLDLNQDRADLWHYCHTLTTLVKDLEDRVKKLESEPVQHFSFKNAKGFPEAYEAVMKQHNEHRKTRKSDVESESTSHKQTH